MNVEFPITRKIIDQLENWVNILATPFLPLVQVPEADGRFHWEFREQRPETLMIGKAVRMASGIRVSLLLADSGFTVECASLLRMVSDFSQEIHAIAMGLIAGRLTEPQERFVRQYFAPMARNPKEYEKRERERYVSREELFKARFRLESESAKEAEKMRWLSRFLNYAYDKYVHGAYLTAMELYSGRDNSFMLNGHESEQHMDIARASVAGKLHEVVSALEMMALMSDNRALYEEIREGRRSLDASEEY
jgi:hypothetical protein